MYIQTYCPAMILIYHPATFAIYYFHFMALWNLSICYAQMTCVKNSPVILTFIYYYFIFYLIYKFYL